MPPPERFGRYEVVRELGRGGMAVVYLARDPRVGRDVAIKVISSDLAGDAEFRRRFDREAQALARLEHSAIVPLYDHGEEDGTPYLVFRYMEGGSLAERVARSGPLALEDVAAIARRVGAALDYAHAQGVIHRDIKPANILFDRNGEAWLGDFGISLAAERTSSLTSGAWIGSPAYMSPEQANGDPATAASDVYSLGCTLFEAVTGSPPFMAERPVALLLKHVQERASPASERRADVPEAVDRALARALAKDPSERISSGGKLAEALVGVDSPVRPVAVVVPPSAQGHGSSLPTIASSVDTGPLSGDLTRAVPEGASPLPTVAEPVVVAPGGRRWRPRWLVAGLAGIGLAGAVAASVLALVGGDVDREKKAGVSPSPRATATVRGFTATATSSPTRTTSSPTPTSTPAPTASATFTTAPTPTPKPLCSSDDFSVEADSFEDDQMRVIGSGCYTEGTPIVTVVFVQNGGASLSLNCTAEDNYSSVMLLDDGFRASCNGVNYDAYNDRIDFEFLFVCWYNLTSSKTDVSYVKIGPSASVYYVTAALECH